MNNYKRFCINKTLSFLEKRVEDMQRINKRPPKRESLVLYRDAYRTVRKFYWNDDKGRPWHETLEKSLRKEFEENRNMEDSVEIGRKIVLGKQCLIDLEEKLLKVQADINKFVSETRTN